MSLCPMSQISIPALAKRTSLSRRNLQRMAQEGLIPGASQTAGGHWRIADDARLAGWVSRIAMNQALKGAVGRCKTAPLRNSIAEFEKRLDAYQWSAMSGGVRVVPDDVLDMLARVEQSTGAALAALRTRNAWVTGSSSLNG